MKIDDALQSMNLNQFEALFQTTVQLEYQSFFSGTVGLKFEGYEGAISYDKLVERVHQAFQKAMEPYIQKIKQNVMYLAPDEIQDYSKKIKLGVDYISKLKVLYKKIVEKENSHLLRKYYNTMFDKQYGKAYATAQQLLQKNEGKENESPLSSKKKHCENWYKDYSELKKEIKWHNQCYQQFKTSQTQREKETAQAKTRAQSEAELPEGEDEFFENYINLLFAHLMRQGMYQAGGVQYQTEPGVRRVFFQYSFPQASQAQFAPQGTQPALDPYKVLEVNPKASSNEIRKAYLEKARICHPDKNLDDPKAKQKFQRLEEAYAVLKDPQKRQIYDAYGIVGK